VKARRGKVLALILAGGEGGRLGALTEGRAKPVLPFGGVYRLIDFPLSNCHHSRVSDVWVIQQYEAHTLSEHLANGRPWDLDRTWGGMRVVHPTTGEESGSGFYEGNADAINRNREAIESFDPELVLVLSADAVYRLDYAEVIDRHRERGAEATAVTTVKSAEEASRLGTVIVDSSGLVTEFEYKPETPRSDIVTTEVFVYDAKVLLGTLAELEDEEGGLSDFGHSLLPRLVERGNTVLVIEHNLDVIKTADWIVDLGPEGGLRGGTVVASGTPEDVANVDASHTGRYLRPMLKKHTARKAG